MRSGKYWQGLVFEWEGWDGEESWKGIGKKAGQGTCIVAEECVGTCDRICGDNCPGLQIGWSSHSSMYCELKKVTDHASYAPFLSNPQFNQPSLCPALYLRRLTLAPGCIWPTEGTGVNLWEGGRRKKVATSTPLLPWTRVSGSRCTPCIATAPASWLLSLGSALTGLGKPYSMLDASASGPPAKLSLCVPLCSFLPCLLP